LAEDDIGGNTAAGFKTQGDAVSPSLSLHFPKLFSDGPFVISASGKAGETEKIPVKEIVFCNQSVIFENIKFLGTRIEM
jgi:hypothetical protein